MIRKHMQKIYYLLHIIINFNLVLPILMMIFGVWICKKLYVELEKEMDKLKELKEAEAQEMFSRINRITMALFT